MSNYLIEHALKNIWCEPIQDKQYIIQPARLTLDRGVARFVKVGWDDIKVPTVTASSDQRYFHIYQIGQIHPSLLNLVTLKQQWVPIHGIMETRNVLVECYLPNGVKIPPIHVWLYLNHDNNLLVAIQIIPTMELGTILDGTVRPAKLDLDAITFRVYSNAYIDSPEFIAANVGGLPAIKVFSRRINTNNDMTTFLSETNASNQLYGSLGDVVYYLDGLRTTRPTAFSAAKHQGRTITMVRDATQKLTWESTVSDLPMFNSVLDSVPKYILFLGKEVGGNTINYRDDIDVFLMSYKDNVWKGIYLDRNDGDEVRQLTHNAYAVKASCIAEAVANHPSLWNNVNEVIVRLDVRQGGLKRGLVHQHNRIEELYRLSNSQILNAMSGIDALLDEWTAAELEQSAYVRLMSSTAQAIENDLDIVSDAYGYHAATQVMANPEKAVETTSNSRYLTLSPGQCLQNPETGYGDRSVFLYNVSGKMIAAFNNTGLYDQIPLAPVYGTETPASAEVFPMRIANNDGVVFGNQTLTTHELTHFGFRCYVCSLVGGTPNEIWSDITVSGLGTYYTYNPTGDISSGYKPTLTWDVAALNALNLYPCVKLQRTMMLYTVPFQTANYPGFLRFSVNSYMQNFNGVSGNRVLKLQPAVLDVFMDGESLIEDIDYYVAWPEIVICKKPKRRPAEGLVVQVRCYGCCDPTTMQRYKAREVGFVKDGLLSVDGEYDVRNDRNIRILVADQWKRRDQVRFQESGTGPLLLDGEPYSVSDYVTPAEAYTNRTTVPYRTEALAIDTAVQNYLTDKLPQPNPLNPAISTDKWPCYSVFMSAIIHAFQNGFLGNGELDNPYDNLQMDTWLSPWLYLLNYDPCVKGANTNYIGIAAHQYDVVISVTQAQHVFLTRLNIQYLASKVNLSPTVSIGS